MNSKIVIEKSTDDIPVYKVYRMTEVKGRMTEYTLCLTTQDLGKLLSMIVEW